MRNIDAELERAGAEFRRSADDLPDRRWDAAISGSPSGHRLRAVAVGVAVVALLGVPVLLFGGRASPDAVPVGGSGTKSPPTSVTQPTTSEATLGAEAVPPVQAEDPPYLLLEAGGWDMVWYSEDSYTPYRSDEPLVFRPPGEDMGTATLVAEIVEITETLGWSAGDGAERIELDGRIVSISDDSLRPTGQMAGVEFDDGTLVVVRAIGVDRTAFVDVAKRITLSPDGDPIVVPPPGYEQVDLPALRAEAVTYRESRYEGPGGASAEVRVWSGTLADLELQAFSRAREARSVRPVTIDGAPATVAYQSPGLERVFVVGGEDGYVIEIDFNPFVAAGTDADLDMILSRIRRVDRTTFETSLPEGTITAGTASDAVAEMLTDIPLPAGFDPSALTPIGDRYQVGAEVVGAVACAWIERWIDAKAAGNVEQAAAAADALATSRNWAILLEMQAEGAYPQVLWEYADAVAGDGTIVAGTVLTVEESYQDAFGCTGG